MANTLTRGLSWYLARFRFGEESGHTLQVRLYKAKNTVSPDYDYIHTDFTELDNCSGYTANGITLNQTGLTDWYLPAVGNNNGPTGVGYGFQYIQYKPEVKWTFLDELPNHANIPLGYYVVVTVSSITYLLWFETQAFPKNPMWNDTYKVTPTVYL
jgi:hypothetical protein